MMFLIKRFSTNDQLLIWIEIKKDLDLINFTIEFKKKLNIYFPPFSTEDCFTATFIIELS